MNTTFMTYKEENEVLRQKIAEQAAVIEKLTTAVLIAAAHIRPTCPGLYTTLKEALATPTNSKQILAEWLDKVLGEPLAITNRCEILSMEERSPHYLIARPPKAIGDPTKPDIPLFKKPEIK